MVRLMVESLEGRELMAAGVLAGFGAAPADGFTPPIGSNKGSVMSDVPTQTNGIIAILIGLQAPTASNEVLASSFQGGCANQGEGVQAVTSGFYILPYIEQENMYKQY